MRDKSKEIAMLEDTLKILKQGWYEKNGKRIQLKLSAKEMQEIQVYLPEAVKKKCSDPEFNSVFCFKSNEIHNEIQNRKRKECNKEEFYRISADR